jgi:Tfp pilus assembly protein PilN
MVTGSTRARRNPGKRTLTGISLRADGLCAADVRLRAEGGEWRATLEPPNGEAGWPSLASALSTLARELGAVQGTLAVAMMPPLTEIRRLELPPLRDDELRRLLARNASRYFVNARGPQIVGASLIGHRKRGAPAPVMAAAASARLVSAIHAAATAAGWTVESIAPAECAWAAAARELWPAFSRERAHVVVAHEDRTDVLQLESGRLVGLRRFRGAAADAALIADSVGASARSGVVGEPRERRAVVTALEQFGVRALVPAGAAAAFADRGDVLAAHFAGVEAGPVLRSEDAAALDRASAARLAAKLGGAAAVLLLGAAALELWGAKHQLREIRVERAALRGQIAATLVGRTTLDATYRQLAALNGVEQTSPRWSAVIASLSEAVPQDAYLTAVRARQDSLIVDGLGEHAARVFDALAGTPGLSDVRAAAPVRREAQDDGPALEHFTIAARVEPPPQRPPAASPASTGQARRPGP